MAGIGPRSRSRWDYPADVAQTVRPAAASSKTSGAAAMSGGSNRVTESPDVTR